MKAISRIALISLAVAGLSACASMDDGRASLSPDTRTIGPDEAYMSRVETIARRRGIDVTWVNPPVREETLVASGD